MRESPRVRRLRNDFRSMDRLRSESTILDFSTPGILPGSPPETYLVRFRGKGLYRPERSKETRITEEHQVLIQLGASYPRMMPDLQWQSPIFHPNISGSGSVCLGGYGTYWVPSLNLDELCEMLWEMIRYQNFDVESPYNREAAIWAKQQREHGLPVDPRPIRDKVAAGMVQGAVTPKQQRTPMNFVPPPPVAPPAPPQPDMIFLDDNGIVEAEVIEPDQDADILFID